jgi:hypothetical protein
MQPTQHREQKQTQRKHTEQYGSKVFSGIIVSHHIRLRGGLRRPAIIYQVV